MELGGSLLGSSSCEWLIITIVTEVISQLGGAMVIAMVGAQRLRHCQLELQMTRLSAGSKIRGFFQE